MVSTSLRALLRVQKSEKKNLGLKSRREKSPSEYQSLQSLLQCSWSDIEYIIRLQLHSVESEVWRHRILAELRPVLAIGVWPRQHEDIADFLGCVVRFAAWSRLITSSYLCRPTSTDTLAHAPSMNDRGVRTVIFTSNTSMTLLKR